MKNKDKYNLKRFDVVSTINSKEIAVYYQDVLIFGGTVISFLNWLESEEN